MARTIKEWVGKTDDSKISNGAKDRICARQGNRCAVLGTEFGPNNKPEFDHKLALWLGGEHRESNLQALSKEAHQAKTAAEASVRSKVNSQRRKHLGIIEPKGTIKSQGFSKAEKSAKPLSKPLPPRRAIYAPVQESQL